MKLNFVMEAIEPEDDMNMQIKMDMDQEALDCIDIMERAEDDENGFNCVADNFGEEKAEAFFAILQTMASLRENLPFLAYEAEDLEAMVSESVLQ